MKFSKLCNKKHFILQLIPFQNELKYTGFYVFLKVKQLFLELRPLRFCTKFIKRENVGLL